MATMSTKMAKPAKPDASELKQETSRKNSSLPRKNSLKPRRSSRKDSATSRTRKDSATSRSRKESPTSRMDSATSAQSSSPIRSNRKESLISRKDSKKKKYYRIPEERTDDKYDYKHILRKNPDAEEDIDIHTIITPDIRDRISAYINEAYKTKLSKPSCICIEEETSPGAAPWWKMNDGRRIPSLGLGTWLGFTNKDYKMPGREQEVQEAVEAAIDAGYRHIDTAFIYDTETYVGEAIRNKIAQGVVKRSDLFVTTKLWNDRHRKEAVVPALKSSLRRLNLSYVDMYLVHWPVGVTPEGVFDNTDYLETWAGMRDARDRLLTRSIGVSNFSQRQLERLCAFNPVAPAVLQVEINFNLQQPDLLRYCRSQNIVVTGYTPFGSLFHSKASADAPRPRSNERRLVELSYKYKKTVPQIALRYLWEMGVIPIPKSVRSQRIQQNINIFDFHLTKHEREVLRLYDKNYRVIPALQWVSSPHYPFETIPNHRVLGRLQKSRKISKAQRAEMGIE